jgi:DNA-binding XRE family transcriptional regulator
VLRCRKPTKIPQNPQTWGEHIKKRRFELGLFQVQVAEIIGVTESTITNWEKNHTKPMLWTIPKIIQFLGYRANLTPSLTIGQKIRAYRYNQGINQEELAHQLGVDPATLGRWERDECQPRKNNVRKLFLFNMPFAIDKTPSNDFCSSNYF